MNVCPAGSDIVALSFAALSSLSASICKDILTLFVLSKLVTLIYLVSCISTAPSELAIVSLFNTTVPSEFAGIVTTLS